MTRCENYFSHPFNAFWTSSNVFAVVAVSAWLYSVVALKPFVIFKAHFIDTDNFLPAESETYYLWLEIVITKGA